MATATQASSTERLMRVIALLAGLAIFFFMVFKWGEEMRALVSGNQSGAPALEDKTAAEGANPALAACLDKRIGDVNKMRDDGVINDSQFEEFTRRARELCLSQNP